VKSRRRKKMKKKRRINYTIKLLGSQILKAVTRKMKRRKSSKKRLFKISLHHP
jgi:hypothetical protein